MVKITYCPGVGLQYKIVGGHKFQYFTPGCQYEVIERDSRAGYLVKGPFPGSKIWVSHGQLRKYFPNADPSVIRFKLASQKLEKLV